MRIDATVPNGLSIYMIIHMLLQRHFAPSANVGEIKTALQKDRRNAQGARWQTACIRFNSEFFDNRLKLGSTNWPVYCPWHTCPPDRVLSGVFRNGKPTPNSPLHPEDSTGCLYYFALHCPSLPREIWRKIYRERREKHQ